MCPINMRVGCDRKSFEWTQSQEYLEIRAEPACPTVIQHNICFCIENKLSLLIFVIGTN